MRVLVVAGGVPYPPTWGSGMRTFQLIRHISTDHDVTLLCHAGPGDTERVIALQQEVPALTIHTVPRTAVPRVRRRADQFVTLASPVPFLAAEVRSAGLQRSLDRLVSAASYDVLQIEGSQLGCLRIPPGPVLVVNEHNVEYEVLDRMRRNERSWMRRAFNSGEYLKYRRFERRQWSRAGALALPSERETEIVLTHAPEAVVATVPNAVDPDYFHPVASPAVPDTLVFTGLLSYRPNFDAARHLVEDILPLVRQERPTVSLTIVGDGDPEHFDALRGPGVTVTGRVEDLRPYVARSAVSCAPIRMGGGTRLKVLEALAMGRPLVSTSLGSEGIAVNPGVDVRIADTAEAFAGQILALLSDPAGAERLGEAGRTLVKQRYTWAAAGDRLEELYERALMTSRRLPRFAA